MILDKENLFSDDQALTVTAVSENVIDLGADSARNQDLNERGDLELFVQVTEALVGGTSVQVQLEEDDDVAFGSSAVVKETAAVLTAELLAGYQFRLGMLPRLSKRYIRLNYVIAGTYTGGTVMGGLVLDRQTNDV